MTTASPLRIDLVSSPSAVRVGTPVGALGGLGLTCSRDPARGAALILVLWFVAALSITVMSFSGMTRVEAGASARLEDAVRAMALGDAAINLALLELDSAPALTESALQRSYALGQGSVDVVARQDTGFVNLNEAPQELLRDTLVVIGGAEPEHAHQLASAVVAWRSPNGSNPGSGGAGGGATRSGRFEATSDLMQVPGFGFDLYAKIARFVTVQGMSPGINIRHAPLEVLKVLAAGRDTIAESVYQALLAGDVGVDTTGLDERHVVGTEGEYVNVQATVVLNGVPFVRTRWMVRGVAVGSAEPWATLAAETSVVGPREDLE